MISTSHPTYAPHHQPEKNIYQTSHNQLQQQRQHNTDHLQQHFASQAPPDLTNSPALSLDLDFDDFSYLNSGAAPGESMLTDTWGGLAQFQQPERVSRLPHQRESSLSSLGSTGPASPYTQNTSNPHIAITDSSAVDELSEMHATQDQAGSFYPLGKPMGNPYAGYQSLDQTIPDLAYPLTIQGPGSRPRTDRGGLLPTQDFVGGPHRSYPPSVASSVAGDSPATPTGSGGDNDVDRRRKGGYGNVAKLERTMTDVYSDDLYSPNFAITSTPPSQPHNISPPNDIFGQRLNAVNSQHMGVSHSPASSTSRDRASPFRAGSPFANTASVHEFTQGAPMNTAQRMREQTKAQNDAHMFRQQMMTGAEPDTPPETISPKDSILEFNEPDGTTDFPLFPQSQAELVDQLAKTMPQQAPQQFIPVTGAASGNAIDQFNYMPPHLPTMSQMQHVPQQYPFVARTQPSSNNQSPPHLSSAGSSAGSGSGTPTRPAGVSADGGTYTCTYHGCTMRFETPALLQKHKREGHRQTHGMTVTRAPQDMAMTSSMLNSQAGPHRCDRINPNTGKPCHTVFSRPYDLTRHEDTIHNARKQKVRCDLCTEDKTFSRADALTRHYRVCHPDMELPGKVRRRGGA